MNLNPMYKLSSGRSIATGQRATSISVHLGFGHEQIFNFGNPCLKLTCITYSKSMPPPGIDTSGFQAFIALCFALSYSKG
jgi:hypothetical protein